MLRSRPVEDTSAHDTLFRDTVARHFPDARLDDDEIELGFGALRIRCRVDGIHELGGMQSASLFFQLRGGRLGDAPMFVSVSGYGDSAEAAIITGACNWTCTYGPLLRLALADEDQPEVGRFDAEVEGQPVRVFVDGLHRAATFDADAGDATDRIPPALARLAPDRWLTKAVIESGRLPMIAGDRPTLLSVFVGELPNGRTVEVKVDGHDWVGMDAVFAAAAPEPAGGMTLLRELAVVVPTGAVPPLSRAAIERTLAGLSEGDPARDAVGWPGWDHHGGKLDAPLGTNLVAALEARFGTLPADYRAFLTTVAAAGAGPGYGLLAPLGESQAALASGRFTWDDDSEPTTSARGVLALAHGGCGVMWLLVIEGDHRGEVWVDARSSDGKVRRVASSFSAWYRDWLAAAARDIDPRGAWDSSCCATTAVVMKMLDALRVEGVPETAQPAELAKQLAPGAIALASGGGDYFAAKAALDPCHGCVRLASHFGWGANLFRPGEPPFTDKRGWFAKLAGRLRGRG